MSAGGQFIYIMLQDVQLTANIEHDPPTDCWRNLVVSNTHEGSHLLPPHVNQIQVLASPLNHF